MDPAQSAPSVEDTHAVPPPPPPPVSPPAESPSSTPMPTSPQDNSLPPAKKSGKTIATVVTLLILGMGTLVGVNLALNRQIIETPASVCAPNNQTELYCNASGQAACHRCIGNEWQELGVGECSSLTCTPCGGGAGGGNTTCSTGGDTAPVGGSCSSNTCIAGEGQFVRHFICSTPLGPNGRCEPQEPGSVVIYDTGDNRSLTSAFFQNDPCTSEQIDLFNNTAEPYKTGFVTAITRDKTSNDCGTVTNTPTPTVPVETPTPTPGLAQCQQVVVHTITRGETEVTAPTANKIQKGDVVVFRATAGNATSTPVESITFQLSVNGQSQATVVVPATQQAGGEYTSDYEVTISEAASYNVVIVSIQTTN